MKSWTNLQLPETLSGKTFIDIGCWEGNMCVEALARGAEYCLGIDYCTSPKLSANLQEYDFSFLQLDIFSEKFLSLPEFDVVLCAGVLYHVENPKSLLTRLRKICHEGSELYLETTCLQDSSDRPLMLYHHGRSFDDNVSNWWSPTERCLELMLTEGGFVDIDITYRPDIDYVTVEETPSKIGRIGFRALASKELPSASSKSLPRRPEFMPNSAFKGSRSH